MDSALEGMAIAEHLLAAIRVRIPDAVGDLDLWANHVRWALDQDRIEGKAIDPVRLAQAASYAQGRRDGFWWPFVQSGRALRRHAEKLIEESGTAMPADRGLPVRFCPGCRSLRFRQDSEHPVECDHGTRWATGTLFRCGRCDGTVLTWTPGTTCHQCPPGTPRPAPIEAQRLAIEALGTLRHPPSSSSSGG